MPDAKISELPAATAPSGVELIEIVQGGVNKQTTTQDIANLGGGGSITSVNGDTGPAVTLDAIDIPNTPAGTIAATTVQAAIDELDSEKQSAAQVQAIADAKVADAINNGTTTIAPSQNAVFDALALKVAITDFAPYVIDQATPSTAGGTITLDMNSQKQRSFIGSATFAAPKTLAMSNTTNSLFFNLIFELTDVAAILTTPADWLMSDLAFDGTSWTPPQIGKYEIGGSFDDVNNVWYVKIQGPFS